MFKPEALVVSLGLDIAKADPTGTWSVTPDGLFEIGRRIGGLKLPTLLVQEGGYNIRSLGRNAARMLTGVCAGRWGGGCGSGRGRAGYRPGRGSERGIWPPLSQRRADSERSGTRRLTSSGSGSNQSGLRSSGKPL